MTENLEVQGYTNFSYRDAIPNRASTFGYMVFVNNCPVSWKSRLMKCVVNSVSETEYVAMAKALKEHNIFEIF